MSSPEGLDRIRISALKKLLSPPLALHTWMIINSIYHNTLYSFHVINRDYDVCRGHYLKRVVIDIRASKNISGLVKVPVTSPAGLMKCFLNVEP